MSDYTTSISSRNRSLLTTKSIPTFVPVARAILRVGAGLLFMQHGAQKLLGLFGGIDGSGATVQMLSQFGIAGVLEFFGGALIVLGLFTRATAGVLVLLMVVAYLIAHAPQGFIPLLNGGELALLYVLIFTFVAGGGPGAFSLDGLRDDA